jgi:tetratricopeptide (TPR) repeat protein
MKLLATLALLGTSIVLPSIPSHAANLDNALAIYLDKLAKTSAVGVVEQDDLLFFIANQQCLSKKKHSGTKESRRARKSITELISREFVKRSNELSRKQIRYPDSIGDAIYNKALSNLAAGSAHMLGKAQLVLDKEIAPCLHRVVSAMPLAYFTKQKTVSPTLIDQEALLLDVLNDALVEKNSTWLSAFFTAFASKELALAYQLQSVDEVQAVWPVYDTVINTSRMIAAHDDDSVNCDFSSAFSSSDLAQLTDVALLTDVAQRGWCSTEIGIPVFNWQTGVNLSKSTKALKKQWLRVDYTGALNIVFNAHGAVNFAPVPQVYRTMASSHLSQAQQLFKSGKKADEIIRLLTIALNLDPKNYQSWTLLGTMMRAKNEHSLALSIYFQALLQQPQNTDLWINMAKSLTALNFLSDANKLATLTLQFSQPFNASDWAMKEAEQLIKITTVN